MKLMSSGVEEVTTGNVIGTTGEFRIKQSAKAFAILSSGLYANKIKAIIRELSCNAIDSHVAAGTLDTPFDVCLPSTLSPYFSVRDYGTGLSEEQVNGIFTTYFESSKTGSDDFIGTLGLGSKSPFSYTNNFSITAIKDGKKCIFTAFISDQGVPSILKMAEENTKEHNGVEIRFSVTSKNDHQTFLFEAVEVFKWFKNRPNVSHPSFKFVDVDYSEKDIVKGVHSFKTSNYRTTPIAVMGNIAYPLNVPDVSTNLGKLAEYLHYPLIIEFDIGELDIAASREELSYIPITITNIKKRLQALHDGIVKYIDGQISNCKSDLEKGEVVYRLTCSNLFSTAAHQWVKDNKFTFGLPNDITIIPLFVKDIKALGMTMSAQYSRYGGATLTTYSVDYDYPNGKSRTADTAYFPVKYVDKRSVIVVNTGKTGITQRIKATFFDKKHKLVPNISGVIFITVNFTGTLTDAEKAKKVDELKKLVHGYSLVMTDADLEPAPTRTRTTVVKAPSTAGFVKLSGLSRWSSSISDISWSNIGTIDPNVTYYYVPLSAYEHCPDKGDAVISDIKRMVLNMCRSGIDSFMNINIVGVQKIGMPTLKKLPNFIKLETYIKGELLKVDTTSTSINELTSYLDCINNSVYNSSIAKEVKNKKGPYVTFIDKYITNRKTPKGSKNYSHGEMININYLASLFGVTLTQKVDYVSAAKVDYDKLVNSYPMFNCIDRYNCPLQKLIVDYINLVDKS